MMTRWRSWGVAVVSACVVTVMLWVGVATAGPVDPAEVAPDVGDKKVSINMAGSLEDVVQELRDSGAVRHIGMPHRRITMPDGSIGMEQYGHELPVVLEFEDAPLREVLLSICEQVGCVYRTHGTGDFVELLAGDPTFDGRPTVKVGEYTLRVGGWSINRSTQAEFRWGQEYEEPTYHQSFTLKLLVASRETKAADKLAGLDRSAVAHLDTGDALEIKGPEGAPFTHTWYGPDAPGDRQMHLSFPMVPPVEAQAITRLEGKLKLFRVVREFKAELAPEKGASHEAEGTSATITNYNRAGKSLLVEILIKEPPAEGVPQALGNMPGMQQRNVWAIAPDGTEAQSRGASYSGGKDGGTVGARFTLPEEDFEIEKIRFEYTSRSDPSEEVPFVIEDIPLSQ